MRHLISILLPLALLASGCQAPAADRAPEIRAEFHLSFAGTKAVMGDPELAQLKDIASLAESAPVHTLITRKLADYLASQLVHGSTNAPDHFTTIIANLIRHEFVFELLSADDNSWRLALNTLGESASEMQDSLRKLVTGQSMHIVDKVDSLGSWHFKPDGAKRTTQVSMQGNWLLLENLTISEASDWQYQIRRDGRPRSTSGEHLYAVVIRSERLEGLLPGLEFSSPFQLEFKASARKGKQRLEGTFSFDYPQDLKLEKFILPTNTLRDPLISFTAARGIAGHFKHPSFRTWRLPEAPKQLISWTQSDIPMYSILAFPLKGSAAWLKRQTSRFEESFGPQLAAMRLGAITNMDKPSAIVWQGLPLIAPFVATAIDQDPDWLFFGTVPGFIPKGPNTNPPPAALLEQIMNRPDLLYYHWEITPPRLQQWRMLIDLGRILVLNSLPGQNNPFPIWLKKLEPLLGNTITEISRVNDRKWKFVRSSHIALTAMELTALTQWLTPTIVMPGLPGL